MTITLSEIKGYGWLGILTRNEEEVYRTGKYYDTAELALAQVKVWQEAH